MINDFMLYLDRIWFNQGTISCPLPCLLSWAVRQWRRWSSASFALVAWWTEAPSLRSQVRWPTTRSSLSMILTVLAWRRQQVLTPLNAKPPSTLCEPNFIQFGKKLQGSFEMNWVTIYFNFVPTSPMNNTLMVGYCVDSVQRKGKIDRKSQWSEISG